jgi:4'-phosphopantetheinyl transferase
MVAADSGPLAVHRWPGPLPRDCDGLIVIGIVTPPSTLRHQARGLTRTALREVLGALLGRDATSVALDFQPSQPPRVDLPDCPIGLSVSHEAGLSVAAINLQGPVGVDLLQVQPVPDWQALARDYLGLATAARLARLSPASLPLALAEAWTKMEATSKCLGLPLEEWHADRERLLARCRTLPLDLPASLAGAVAVGL